VHSDIAPKHTDFAGNFADQASLNFVESGQSTYNYRLSDYVDRRSAASPQELYNELDGALARQGELAWRLRVSAIHEVGADRWIQLSAAGSTGCDLVLQVTQAARSTDVIASVEAWLADPVATSRVIHLS
jgi:hypothetical protein